MNGHPAATVLWRLVLLSLLLAASAQKKKPAGTCSKGDLRSCPDEGVCQECIKGLCYKALNCCATTADCPKCFACCGGNVCKRDPYNPLCCTSDGECSGKCSMCGADGKCTTRPGCCTSNSACGPCQTCGPDNTCQGSCGPKIENDPELTGFDGKKHMFLGVGDFVLLKEHGGIEVAATFTKAKPPGQDENAKEYSWTQTVRVTSPEGEVLLCHLPGVLGPDTQRIKVTATTSDGDIFKLKKVSRNATQTVRFKSMYVKGVVKKGRLVGCQARSERLNVYVIQMFGPDQAARDTTGKHEFAKPFTWLNMAFQVPRPLRTPVTGLIGRTYPLNEAASSRRLRVSADGSPELWADAPVPLAGITAAPGEDLAELVQ